MAVPPLAEMPSVVLLAMVPPSTANGAASVAAAVDVADRHCAAISGSGGNATVTSRSGICELHFLTPSLWPPSEPFHVDPCPPGLETGAPVCRSIRSVLA
jgi:hypothetical protein